MFGPAPVHPVVGSIGPTGSAFPAVFRVTGPTGPTCLIASPHQAAINIYALNTYIDGFMTLNKDIVEHLLNLFKTQVNRTVVVYKTTNGILNGYNIDMCPFNVDISIPATTIHQIIKKAYDGGFFNFINYMFNLDDIFKDEIFEYGIRHRKEELINMSKDYINKQPVDKIDTFICISIGYINKEITSWLLEILKSNHFDDVKIASVLENAVWSDLINHDYEEKEEETIDFIKFLIKCGLNVVRTFYTDELGHWPEQVLMFIIIELGLSPIELTEEQVWYLTKAGINKYKSTANLIQYKQNKILIEKTIPILNEFFPEDISQVINRF